MNRDDDDDDDQDWYDVETVDPDEFFTVPCSECGAEIFEDTPRCPTCGHYVTQSRTGFWEGKPFWYAVIAFLGILAVITVCLFAF